MVEHKDVVVSLLSASAGLGGLILVFLGLAISSFQALQPPVPDPVRSKYKQIAVFVLVAFIASVGCVGVAAMWLVGIHDNRVLYLTTVSTFFAQLALLLAATIFVVQRLVWRKT